MQLARALYFDGKTDEALALLQAEGGTSYPFGIYLRGSILAATAPDQRELAKSLLEEASRQGVAGADYRLWGILQDSDDPASKASAAQRLTSAAKRGDPRAETQLALMAEKDAMAERDGVKRQASLVQAFRHWARSAHFAEMQDWPPDEPILAMTRRGTLAHYLVRHGMRLDEVSSIFLEATGIKQQELGLP
jgi:TPR repeat protein